jgi:hypothetical protein
MLRGTLGKEDFAVLEEEEPEVHGAMGDGAAG